MITPKFSTKEPPIYPELVKRFGVSMKDGIVIAYGDTIYSQDPIPKHLEIHECVHLEQQAKYGVEWWWNKYLEDKHFRLEQEVEAYQAQAQYMKANFGRQEYRSNVRKLAKDLSSGIYGRIISYEDALRVITCKIT